MTHKVRVPLWFPLMMCATGVLLSATTFINYLNTGARPLLFFAIVPLLIGAVSIAFRSFATLQVEPDLVVSRTQYRRVKKTLHPTDRLEITDGRLFVVDYQGIQEEIPLNLPLLRKSDWLEFEKAVARRWPSKA